MYTLYGLVYIVYDILYVTWISTYNCTNSDVKQNFDFLPQPLTFNVLLNVAGELIGRYTYASHQRDVYESLVHHDTATCTTPD